MQYPNLQEGLEDCVNSCLQCFAKCTETVQKSLVRGGKQADSNFIALLEICADTCETTARAMLLRSSFYGEFCDLCAKLCNSCAESCNAMNDITLEDCAEICRQTARACVEMHAEAEEWKWAKREAEAGSTMHI